MKKIFPLLLAIVLGTLLARSNYEISEVKFVAIIFEDNIRLAFAMTSAIVMNIAYYFSIPSGESWWSYMDLKRGLKLLLIFVALQVVFNILYSAVQA